MSIAMLELNRHDESVVWASRGWILAAGAVPIGVSVVLIVIAVAVRFKYSRDGV